MSEETPSVEIRRRKRKKGLSMPQGRVGITLTWLLRHPHYKALSLLIAASVWLYAQGAAESVRQVTATVAWKWPTGLVPNDPLPGTVALSIKGTRSATRLAEGTEIVVPVDLTSITSPGEKSVTFSLYDVENLPANVEITGWTPSSILFRLEELRSRKVEIVPRIVGEPNTGYRVASVEIEPRILGVRGPASAVEGLLKVLTDPVEVSGLRHNQRYQVQPDLPRGVEAIDAVQAVVSVTVEPRTARKTLPARVYIDPPGLAWRPITGDVSVTLTGPAAALREVGPRDVMVFVMLPDNPGQDRYKVRLTDGPGVRAEVRVSGTGEVKVEAIDPPVIEVLRQ